MSKFANVAAKAVKEGKVKEHDKEGGTFEREVPAAGNTLMRFISYVEIGLQPQPDWNNQKKDPARMAIWQFELKGKKHAKEITTKNEAGEEETKTIYPVITIRKPIKTGSKSAYTKILSAMQYGRADMVHPAMMLGEGFLGTIIHNTRGEGKDAVTYANLNDESGGWTMRAPVRVDEEGEESVINVPAAVNEERCLLWDAPDMEQWGSLYIPGTYTKKAGKEEVEVSKNWLQDACVEALDYSGSALEAMLLAEGGDLPGTDTSDGLGDASEDDLDDLGGEGTSEGDTASDEAETGSDDPLADLGLD